MVRLAGKLIASEESLHMIDVNNRSAAKLGLSVTS